MIYYFDITETYVKTVGIEADSLSQAFCRVDELYHSKDIDLFGLPDDIEIEYVQDMVEELTEQGDITPEEIEVF